MTSSRKKARENAVITAIVILVLSGILIYTDFGKKFFKSWFVDFQKSATESLQPKDKQPQKPVNSKPGNE